MTNRFAKSIGILAAGALALGLTACGGGGEAAGGESTGGGEGDLTTVGFVAVGPEGAWRKANEQNIQDTFTKEAGFDLKYAPAAKLDQKSQIDAFTSFVDEEVDVILLSATEGQRAADRVAKIRFPDPAPSGRVPLTAEGLSKSYGSLEVFTGVDLAIDRGANVVVLGLNGAGKTTLLRILAGLEEPDTGRVLPGHGLKLGYYAQEHETIDVGRSVLDNMVSASPNLDDTQVRKILGSFLFTGDDVDKPAKVLSGGEKTRLALAMLVVSAANVLLLDEPTNNLDPASRAEVLDAIRTYAGAVVLVTHDEGAVDALQPDRVLLLPDGDEDLWSPEYSDLISLA